jgi:hypothetical protein
LCQITAELVLYWYCNEPVLFVSGCVDKEVDAVLAPEQAVRQVLEESALLAGVRILKLLFFENSNPASFG